MIPSAVHYIAYRPPERPQPLPEANPPTTSEGRDSGDDSAAAHAKSNGNARPGAEQLTPADRNELDAIIKHKDK